MLADPPTHTQQGPVALAPASARNQWTDLVDADPTGLVSQSPEWLDALSRMGYEDASRTFRAASGARMILPLARRRRSMPRALAPLASMPPAWGMGGLLAEETPGIQDVARVVDELCALPSMQITVRPNPVHAKLWAEACRRPRITAIGRRAHVLDLAGGSEFVWNEVFAPGARRAVRKAERAGLEVRAGSGPDLLSDFQGLFDLSVRRWAAAQREPVSLARMRAFRRDPPAKFLHVADALPRGLRIWIAYHEDTPVAGLIVLLGRNASYTRGAMDVDRAGSLRANELLHWSAIREACAAGCNHYHLGETGCSSSLARFKEKFGALPVSYAEYRIERLPLTRAAGPVKATVKRAIGFRDD